MTMLPFAWYLRYLREIKFTCGELPRVIFNALRIVKNHVILIFTIAALPVNWLKILFTRFLTAFYNFRIQQPVPILESWWVAFVIISKLDKMKIPF